MNKKVAGCVVLALAVLVGGFFLLTSYTSDKKQAVAITNYKNAEYIIGGVHVKLKNGISETEVAPGSASKIVTTYFGNEVRHDFDGDGREDVVFLLTQNAGGSGTFYYVVAALDTAQGYVGSEGLLLGDRIAPQTTEMGKGNVVVVNYADRKPGESFAVQPSAGKSIWLLLDTKSLQFGEVAQNFEGEADPSRMTLGMKKWRWIRAEYGDGKTVTPAKAGAFTLTFKNDGSFSASTDCNGVGGNYIAKDGKIYFDKMMSTLMYCEGSEEGVFTKLLTDASSFRFTSRGELILGLKQNGGSAIFR